MTLEQVLDRVYAGEMVILNNDWYWEEYYEREDNRDIRKWRRVWTDENKDIFDYIYMNHPEIAMDDDGVKAAVIWIYLRTCCSL